MRPITSTAGTQLRNVTLVPLDANRKIERSLCTGVRLWLDCKKDTKCAPAANQRLSKGFPNKEGARSSRNSSNWALAPTLCPDALLSGTIASTAICQATATHERPSLTVATYFVPRELAD